MFLNIELVPNIYFFKVFRSISRHIINETRRRVRPLKRLTVKQSEYGKFVKKKMRYMYVSKTFTLFRFRCIQMMMAVVFTWTVFVLHLFYIPIY